MQKYMPTTAEKCWNLSPDYRYKDFSVSLLQHSNKRQLLVMDSKKLLALLIVSTFLLAACSTTPEQPEPKPQEDTANAAAPEAEPIEVEPVYRPIPEDALYALLVAEFAARRKHYDVALGHYMDQAHKTKDAGVAARATHLAQYLKADRAAMDSAMLWVSLEPNNVEANYLAAVTLSRNHQPRTALGYMHKVSTLGGQTNYASLAATKDISTEDRQALIEDFDQLLIEQPDNIDILIGKALLLSQLNQQQEALKVTDKVLEIEPAHLRTMILEAKLLLQLQRPNEAFVRIERALEENPDNVRLRLQYARLLTRVDLIKAQQQFFILAEQHPRDPDIIFSLALIYKENGLYGDAEERFKQMLSMNKRSSEAHYYLGQLAERKGNTETAMHHYRAVKPGVDYLAATKQLAKLLVEQEQTDQALALLSQAREQSSKDAVRFYLLEADLLIQLGHFKKAQQLLSEALIERPDNNNLLYARSMVSEKRNNLPLMESDLRTILAHNPNSTLALNALGYVLSDRTDRLDEAERLIRKAHELQPEDPAIMDSMGWLLFKQGKSDEALVFLKQAFNKFPDHEVAAHLGEVLWSKGEHEQAKTVWRTALQKHPDSPILAAVLKRLKVDLTPPAQNDTSKQTDTTQSQN